MVAETTTTEKTPVEKAQAAVGEQTKRTQKWAWSTGTAQVRGQSRGQACGTT